MKGIKFLNISMEEYSFEEQVNFANATDLLVGVHGNGLTHAAFMKPHRAVCEIYPTGTEFQWDYYTLSKMMGHEYMCMFDGDVVPPSTFTLGRAPCTKPGLWLTPIVGMITQLKEEI